MSDTTIDWGEFAGSGGQYPERFKFNSPGDAIAGTIVDIRIATMPDGDRLPSLSLRDDQGTEWSLLASQRGLQALLASHRPASGDRISIVYTGDGEAKPGKNAPKLFDVAVVRPDGGPAPAAAAPTPPAPAAPSAADLI
jgi:hypothetical protein